MNWDIKPMKMENELYEKLIWTWSNKSVKINTIIQTRFQKSWDTVQIVNKKGMQ